MQPYTIIYNLIQLYTTMYNHIQSYTTTYTIIYNCIQLYTTIYNHTRPYTTIYNHIQPYTTIYGHPHWQASCDHIQPYAIIYSHIQPLTRIDPIDKDHVTVLSCSTTVCVCVCDKANSGIAAKLWYLRENWHVRLQYIWKYTCWSTLSQTQQISHCLLSMNEHHHNRWSTTMWPLYVQNVSRHVSENVLPKHTGSNIRMQHSPEITW